MSALKGKKILLGISGSIAAYKSVLLLRELQKKGAEVRVILTPAATQFVNPLTFEAITHSPVISDLVSNQSWNNHIEISLWADLYIIAPATANTIAKMACGLADEIVSATHLAARCPVYIAPSMDVDMWHHRATQQNINTLVSRGIHVVPVGNGYLASGLTGEGRMAEPQEIVDQLTLHFSASHDTWNGKKVLITAGPTYENIDPVRFIGNASTGKMGIAIADVFANAGAQVTLVLGPTSLLPKNKHVDVQHVKTANQMFDLCKQIHPIADVAIFTAAVADYKPENQQVEKIKKLADQIDIRLVKNPDIAYELGKNKKANQLHIGFALESTSGEEYAREKVVKKNFDFLVLNSLQDKGAGFGHDTNKTTFVYKDNNFRKFELKSKESVAQDILAAASELVFNKKV